jgi:uncharacterized protein
MAKRADEASKALTARDWLLLLFDGAPEPIDRVRIQKAMFLFAQRTRAPKTEKYDFTPYDYGPFSFEIYPELARLQSQDLIKSEPGTRSIVYSLTSRGRLEAGILRAAVPPERLRILHELRSYEMERSFNRLLEDIYKLYPNFATRSIFRRA